MVWRFLGLEPQSRQVYSVSQDPDLTLMLQCYSSEVFFGKQFCLNESLVLQLGSYCYCRIICTEYLFFVWSRGCSAVWKLH